MSEKINTTAQIGNTKYITKLQTGAFSLQADEPVSLGGSGTAPAPMDYLHSALASCVAITLSMYVERKGWDTGEIKVNVIPRETETGETLLLKEISTEKQVTEDQRKRLLNIANKCPVAKLLKSGVEQEVAFV